MKPSLKNRIEKYFLTHPDEWIHGEDITRKAQDAGCEGETGRRRLRDLLEEGKIITESRKGVRTRSNWYKLNKEKYQVQVYRVPQNNLEIRQMKLV